MVKVEIWTSFEKILQKGCEEIQKFFKSGSRSSSVRHHSRKSKKSHKRSQSDSSLMSPSQSVGRGSTSRTADHSKRKVVRKNRKSRSDSRSKPHSRKSVLKHGKKKSYRRSRSTSRYLLYQDRWRISKLQKGRKCLFIRCELVLLLYS